jgi:hypothetical protein
MGIALFDNNYCWFAAEITQWLLNKAHHEDHHHRRRIPCLVQGRVGMRAYAGLSP